ncbi:MAG: polyprenyl synthetase family protein [Ginsengibacter sp.]|jgi:geranylgeranyl diphosphate synthase type II
MPDGKINNQMSSFKELSAKFEERFCVPHFPAQPQNLYEAAQYLLSFGGKRIRPVLCLMGNELFEEVSEDAFHAAMAIELFHNFTLVHDDIMDKAPLRRGADTVHTKFGESTALLAGDVMLIQVYNYLNKIGLKYLHSVLDLFNRTAQQVCEGQQMDMDFENRVEVNFEEYVKMIELKTSVLLAGSIQLGAILGGSGIRNQEQLFEFGKNLGIAFQVQDDYLDAFGDPEKFGKKWGGDIMANKKTFLWIQATKVATLAQREEMTRLLKINDESKIASMLAIYKDCNIDDWAKELKQEYLKKAMHHLEEVAVISVRKQPLEVLANYLMNRDV